MPVFTVFYIGTAHKMDETSNILVGLHSFVDAQALVARDVPAGGAGQFKMIFDGADNLANVAGMISDFRTPAVQLILRLQALQPHTANDPWNIHLVGHSRGAVAAVALAAELNKQNNPAFVKMFLIDPVRRVAFADAAEQDFGTAVHNNTHEFLEFYMEDDTSPNLFALSPTNLPAAGGRPTVRRRIRLPGTHGTATQCNEVQAPGGQTPVLDLNRAGLRIWPIGSVALRTILGHLRRWGTRLTAPGDALIGQTPGRGIEDARFHRMLLNEYWRVVSINRWEDGQRWVNDVSKSKPRETQKFRRVKSDRSETELRGRGVANPFRSTNVFANNEHFELFSEVWDSGLPDGSRFAERVRNALLEHRNLGDDAPTNTAIRGILARMLGEDRNGFVALAQSSIPDISTFLDPADFRGVTPEGRDLFPN